MKKYVFLLSGFLLLNYFSSSQTVTTTGTDFWVAFPPNFSTATIKLFISSDFVTSGSISSAVAGVNQDFDVNPGNVTEIILPPEVILQPGVESKGIHITSNDPVAVYGLSYRSYTTDAYLAIPTNGLGIEYRILSYTSNTSGFCVVSTQDGTQITFNNFQSGQTTIVDLDMGQTYYFKSQTGNDDVSGSRVQSNFPVAVFGTVTCVNIPWNCVACDHIVEELFPYNSWGKNFVTVPLAGRDNSGDIFRIVAATDMTDIVINGTLATTINTDQYYETNLAGYNSITTSNATMVAQYAKGMSCSGNITGDPFMMLIFPEEQFLKSYTIINVAGYTSHWVNVVAPQYALGNIYQDGVLIPIGAFTQIGTTNFYGAQRSVTEGSHTFNCTSPFGVFVYGWNTMDSYGYPGGGSLSPIGMIDTVLLSPDYTTGQLNISTVCLTATVKDNFMNPVTGVLVNFHVFGIDDQIGNSYTDTQGNAEFCYARTGTTPGTDYIFAEAFGFLSDTSEVVWSFTPPCTNPVSGGTIGNNQSGCGSYTPAMLTGLLPPSGFTGTLEYRWQLSTVSSSSGFTDIAGSNSESYAPGPILQTTWYKRIARVDCMPDWSGAAESNVVELHVVVPLEVWVSVTASSNNGCEGTMITYTAVPVNGGTNPLYQWMVNGNITGNNNPVFSYVPANADMVSCRLTSSETCTSSNPAISNTVQMNVIPNLTVDVNVVASSNPFCQGSQVLFTATPVNGGNSPVFQWRVNGTDCGTNSPIYTYAPSAGDIVTCRLTSSEICTTNNPAAGNQVVMSEYPAPVMNFIDCFDVMTILSARPFQLKGGLPLGGFYSGPGVNSTAGIFTPAMAGTGAKNITYTYTNAYLCSASAATTITVVPDLSFSCGSGLTDIRDGSVYPTLVAGSQCWMAANLNYGTWIQSSVHQTDNCITEKYCKDDLAVNCQSGAVMYQWDELIQFGSNSGPLYQGVCPPGWHIPSSSEFQSLINGWQGNGLAGAFLTDLYLNPPGFEALLQGIACLNTSWAFTPPDIPSASFFWTSSTALSGKIITRGVNDRNQSVSLYESSKANAFPVRCVKD